MNGFINFNNFNFNAKINTGEKNTFITEEMILTPLYKKINYPMKSIAEILPIDNLTLELYCNKCGKRRIYTFASIGTEYFFQERSPGSITGTYHGGLKFKKMMEENKYFYFIAKADCGHDLIVVFKIIDDNTIMKIGQSPSIYDMNEEINNKPFLKELGEEHASFYKTACSLNSFNSNIGAMTYLRRIFEKLLLDCFNENVDKIDIEKETFLKLRMEDKLEKLKNFLPDIIFADGYNKIYSKISDGIHNLSEDECETLFIPLRMAIEEILVEKLELKAKKIRQEKLGKQLQNI